jgi:hypothetical protein
MRLTHLQHRTRPTPSRLSDTSRRRQITRYLLGTLCAIAAFTSCDPDPPHPNQQAVERAEKHADQAIEQGQAAQREAKHQQRLCEIDRMRFGADVTEMKAQVAALRGLALAETVTVLAALVWLAIEARRRRVLAAIVRGMLEKGGGETRIDTSPPP